LIFSRPKPIMLVEAPAEVVEPLAPTEADYAPADVQAAVEDDTIVNGAEVPAAPKPQSLFKGLKRPLNS
jgi:hypothetical protein